MFHLRFFCICLCDFQFPSSLRQKCNTRFVNLELLLKYVFNHLNCISITVQLSVCVNVKLSRLHSSFTLNIGTLNITVISISKRSIEPRPICEKPAQSTFDQYSNQLAFDGGLVCFRVLGLSKRNLILLETVQGR